MSSKIGQPQQHNQPSRKGKKAWRKNVDITEVQVGLEALREDIIHGGPISEKKSEDLFAVDTVGSEAIKKNLRLQKPLKVDEILAKRSVVPGVDSRKRSGTRVTDGVLEHPSKRQKKDWVSKKEVQRLKQVANTTSYLQGDADHDALNFDLWEADEPEEAAVASTREYVPVKKPKVAPSSIKQAPIPMTASGKAVQSISNPGAGTSYNPAFEDWDELLNEEGEKELAAEQARIKQAEAEAEKQARIAQASKDTTLAQLDDESAWEGFETEPDEAEILRQKRPQRKTPVQRNKAKRRKEAERLAKHERRTTEKQTQIASTIQALITRESSSSSLSHPPQPESSTQPDDLRLRRRRRGNIPIPEAPLELVLPDELQESLRQLKPEGNLLQDRFRNLLVNGKIESRRPVLAAKQRKVKVTEKWAYKDFSVAV